MGVAVGSTSGLLYVFNSLDSPAPSGVVTLTLPSVGEEEGSLGLAGDFLTRVVAVI